MKRVYLILMLILTVILPMSAKKDGHKGNNRHKEVLEFKMKYLAQEMELTKEQQPRFFDLYAKMSNEKHAAYKSVRHLEKEIKNNPKASEADYRNLSTATENARRKEMEIDRRYEQEFTKFLTPKQIYKMREGEKTFRKKMSDMRKKK